MVPATACTSSMITVCTPRRDSRAAEVSSRNSDSGVVTSTSGGVRANCRRSSAGVSPVRMPTVMSGTGKPSLVAAWRMPASGERRLRCTSTASALSGDTYSTRQRWTASAGGPAARRSRAQRNAASVLPEPVGATTSAWRPACAAAQAPSCAAVGAAKAPRNHSAVAGEKPSSALTGSMMRPGSDSLGSATAVIRRTARSSVPIRRTRRSSEGRAQCGARAAADGSARVGRSRKARATPTAQSATPGTAITPGTSPNMRNAHSIVVGGVR